MANLEILRSHGWHITSDGLNLLSDNGSNLNIRDVIRRALDVDIRDFGAPIIASEINKQCFGPVNLQIVKIQNISAPKSKPNSQGAPRMLKVILTDGHIICQGVEIKQLLSLSVDKTAPGTKVFIDGAPIISGSILLSPENCKVLGGNVSALVEKWQLSKLMSNHIRHNEDGPPPWVNFGTKIVNTIDNRGFKSLENKNKESSKENAEFQNLRQDAILEATQGAVKKTFGGGVKPAQTFNSHETYSNHYHNNPSRAPRQPKGKNKDKSEPEKMEKPSQRVSLFDYLEDKLSLTDNTVSKSSTKVFTNDVPSTKPKHEHFENNNPRNKSHLNMNSSSQKHLHRDFSKPIKPPQVSHSNPNTFNNSVRHDYENKPKTHQPDGRYQNDKPPRFQRQKQETSKFTTQNDSRPKPNTHIFVDKLANEINNISLYNSKYENEKLRQPKKYESMMSKPWKWKVGDKCMAKYWEDDKFYNAVVTGITNKTCMVEFTEYGNFEEVLHCDCIPVTTDKDDRKSTSKLTETSDFQGSIEFRRGKSRPYMKNSNKSQGQNKTYDS